MPLCCKEHKFRRSKHKASLNLGKLSTTIEFRSVKFIVIPNLKLHVNFYPLIHKFYPTARLHSSLPCFTLVEIFKSSSNKISLLRHANFVGSHFYAKEKIIKRSRI